jgi:hypothetical protein
MKINKKTIILLKSILFLSLSLLQFSCEEDKDLNLERLLNHRYKSVYTPSHYPIYFELYENGDAYVLKTDTLNNTQIVDEINTSWTYFVEGNKLLMDCKSKPNFNYEFEFRFYDKTITNPYNEIRRLILTDINNNNHELEFYEMNLNTN